MTVFRRKSLRTYGQGANMLKEDMAEWRLLLTQNLHNQVFFGTEKAVSFLAFSEVYDVCID
jgi:hypothetical protein